MKLLVTAICSLLFLHTAAQQYYLVVGTYQSAKSEGIYVFDFDTTSGQARQVSMVKAQSPSYITVAANEQYIFAALENAPADGSGGDVAAYSFDKSTGVLTLIDRQKSGGDHPCRVSTSSDDRWLYVANYSSGSFSSYRINSNGSLTKSETLLHQGRSIDTTRQRSSHVHDVLPVGLSELFVADLGTDKIYLYDRDIFTGKIKAAKQHYIDAVPGSGPRSVVFHPNRRYVYAIEELSGTVSVYRHRQKKLKRLQRTSTRAANDTRFAGSADIKVSPDGRFVYASNRGQVNSIAIYAVHPKKGTLRTIGFQTNGINNPRNFSIDPSGKFLLCGNQSGDEIAVFSIDRQTGLLTDTHTRIPVGKPVCLQWIRRN